MRYTKTQITGDNFYGFSKGDCISVSGASKEGEFDHDGFWVISKVDSETVISIRKPNFFDKVRIAVARFIYKVRYEIREAYPFLYA